MTKVRIAVVGAGVIGKMHASAIAASDRASLACVVDPAEAGRAYAESIDAPWRASLDEMIVAGGVDGVILATPNQMHIDGGLTCLDAGLPVLVEKPLASDIASARRLVEAAEAKGVPIATGHHRRHNPLVAKARELVQGGRLGRIATVQATTWFMKPDAYFDVAWRRKKGAGPVYTNLIHDVDMLRCFCGDVAAVQALEANAIRGNEVEDTAAILLRFENGALGTLSVSDTVVAPWSWELTARENPVYPATAESCYLIGGSEGSLSLPNLALWANPGERSWHEPIGATKFPFGFEDPLVRQVEQFAAVILGEERPLVSGLDGLKALEVVEAVKISAAEGRAVEIASRLR